MFPPAPESRDTSGVVVGASGYGFIPPGVKEIIQGGRGKKRGMRVWGNREGWESPSFC